MTTLGCKPSLSQLGKTYGNIEVRCLHLELPSWSFALSYLELKAVSETPDCKRFFPVKSCESRTNNFLPNKSKAFKTGGANKLIKFPTKQEVVGLWQEEQICVLARERAERNNIN